MDKPAEKRSIAWQPLTPKGVAAFATAKFDRLWLVQLIFAIIAGVCVAWCLNSAWIPVIWTAVDQLPDKAEISRASLKWDGEAPRKLADNQFLSLAVDLKHEGLARSPAHIQVELGQNSLKIMSLLGFVELSYPSGWRIGLSRAEAQPWWGAWRLPLLWISGATTLCLLMVIWTVLSTLYFLPTWMMAFFANRQCTVGGAWRICGAALMPGALVFCASIIFYGMGALDFPELALLAAIHIAIGWVYIASALFCLAERPEEFKQAENPFAAARAAQQASDNPFTKQIANENPFATNAKEEAAGTRETLSPPT
jgi:MFS family permease